VLRRGSAQFHEAAAIEGSARFKDGAVLNYAERIDGGLRWLETASATGLDARGCELVALRSAAIDPNVIEIGTILLLEETQGLTLPDGSRHDGLWVAADTGEAILGDRIDLYTGLGLASMETVRGFGIGHLQALTVRAMGRVTDCAWMND
jgi:3D (Asp-Asp-Asp) domain-containing protein